MSVPLSHTVSTSSFVGTVEVPSDSHNRSLARNQIRDNLESKGWTILDDRLKGEDKFILTVRKDSAGLMLPQTQVREWEAAVRPHRSLGFKPEGGRSSGNSTPHTSSISIGGVEI